MRLATFLIAPSLFFMAIVAVASSHARADAGERLDVFADIRPVAYLVEQIGGRHVSVGTLVPAQADPHVFEPTPRQVVALSKARLYFHADLPLDRQIRAKIGVFGGGLDFVDTTAGIKKHASRCGPGCTHGDGHHIADGHHTADGHGHQNADPHVWLSPPLLCVMAENITAALEKADPAQTADYRANLKRLRERIEQTDRAIGKRLAPYRGRTFYVFHPAFSYMADHYGLKQRAVQIEGRGPSPKHLRSLIKEAKADRIGVVFIQGQFDRRPAQTVAKAIGAELATIDPLAKDVLANLDELSKKLADAMGERE